jgi:hypothetical protein
MAKIKQTFKGTLSSAGFAGGEAPTATFTFETGQPVIENGEAVYTPHEAVTLPIEAKRLAKLLNVTEVEVTITVTPKGAKKARKARKAKNATVETTALTATNPEA